MDKSPDAYRTISEVADDLDIPQHVLRFWETKFTQIKPLKRGGGRRYYKPDDIDLVRGIKHLLYGSGYTIKGVQKILKDDGPKYVQAIGRFGGLDPHEGASHRISVPENGKDLSDETSIDPFIMGGKSDILHRTASHIDQKSTVENVASVLGNLVVPARTSARTVNRTDPPQLGLFGESPQPQSQSDASLLQGRATLLPSAWQSADVSKTVATQLRAALAELEECSRLLPHSSQI